MITLINIIFQMLIIFDIIISAYTHNNYFLIKK
jgi:hypothetical protein